MPHMEEELLSFTRQLDRNRAELMREFDELRKDSERLDWLLENASISMLRKDEDGEEWWVELTYSEPRSDIDDAMKGTL